MTQTETTETIMETVYAEGTTYADLRFAKFFAAFSNQPETDVLNVVRAEARERLEDLSGRGQYERAIRAAIEMIVDLYLTAEEQAIPDLPQFVAARRTAAAWATLAGRQSTRQRKPEGW